MDGQIFRVLKKICLFLFAGDIFVHAIVGASIINGMLAGTLSMGAMLLLIILISNADRKRRIKKDRKKRQGTEKNLIFFLPHTRQKITGSFPVPLLFYDFHYFVVRTGYGAFPCIGLEAHK